MTLTFTLKNALLRPKSSLKTALLLESVIRQLQSGAFFGNPRDGLRNKLTCRVQTVQVDVGQTPQKLN